MTKEEKELRYRIAETLGELAEEILRRKAPFDKLPLQEEVAGSLYMKYCEYYDEIDEVLKEKFIGLEVECSKYLIRDSLIGEKEAFVSKYPEYMETRKLFKDWIAQREGPQGPVYIEQELITEKIKVNQTIKQIMKERKPDFTYDKGEVYPGYIPFSKPWLGDNKVFICIDKGTKRTFLTFDIGIEKPKFFLDIATFFDGGQSSYKYNSSEELVKQVHKALDLIDLIMPHFLERIERVLKQG